MKNPLIPVIGSNLELLLKIDDRKVLDGIVRQYNEHGDGCDGMVQAWLIRLRDRIDVLEALRESVATIDGEHTTDDNREEPDTRDAFMSEEHVQSVLGWIEHADVIDNNDTGRHRSVILPEDLATRLAAHLREWHNMRARFYGALTRNKLDTERHQIQSEDK